MKQLLATALLVAGLSALTACAGFQPLHATTAGQTAFDRMSVDVTDGDDEADRAVGFLVRQRLADRMGAPDGRPQPYTLTVEPRVLRIGLGVSDEDRATRFDSQVRASWTLLATSDGSTIAQGRSDRTSSYSASRDPYQLLTTTDQANQRAAREVADELL
ncbi:MAG: hypothetical protein WBF53_00250, partial [Litorimonas sp.]